MAKTARSANKPETNWKLDKRCLNQHLHQHYKCNAHPEDTERCAKVPVEAHMLCPRHRG